MSDTTRLYMRKAIIELLDKADDRAFDLIWRFVRALLKEV